MAVANIVKSSLGPVGLDKMLVDDIGDVTITNDGATILRLLEVEHPAARILVDLAQLQEREVGDGTTTVVLLAAELLRRGQELLRVSGGGLHPTTILSGYRAALKAAIAYVKQELVIRVKTDLSIDQLTQAAKTSLQSKMIGNTDTESDFFANMAVKAVQAVQMKKSDSEEMDKTSTEGEDTAKTTATNAASAFKYPLSAIHVLKAHGQSTADSYVLEQGFCVATNRASQGMPTHLSGATSDASSPTTATANSTTTSSSSLSSSAVPTNGTKPGLVAIAMLDMNLQRHRMGLGIELKVTDPKEVEKIQQRELDITKEKVAKILASGAKVVLTTKGIDDTCLKYFVEAGVLAARRVPLSDLKRLAKATGGSVIVTMADLEGNESLDPTCLGHCTEVQEVRVGDGEILHFLGVQGQGAATIVLRGANEYMLDEMERALHDAMSVVKRMLESPTLVAGGGACEAALSVYLEQYATTNPGVDAREQWAILEFAQALLVIPKTLAVNAAKDSSQLVAQLRTLHAKSLSLGDQQKKDAAVAAAVVANSSANGGGGDNNNNNKEEPAVPYKYYGLDLVNGTLRDNVSAGVVEPAMSKIKALRFATEAAITILRIDDRIVVAPDEQQGR